MRASSRKLAAALAGRLTDVLPSPYAARASGNEVEVYAGSEYVGGSPAASILEDEDGDAVGERAERAAWAVLSGIQDAVAVHGTVGWPLDADHQMALPDVRSDSRRLYLWFGSSELDPVVALQPIELSELVES